MTLRPLILSAMFTATVFISCSHSSVDAPRSYPIHGEIVGFDAQRGRVIVSHAKIPGLMEAMTMPFRLRDTALLRNLTVGDSIHGVLVADKTGTVLDSIRHENR